MSALSSKEYPLQKHIAFLFVGKDMSKESMPLERNIQNDLIKRREKAGILSGDLPIVSYHFNKVREKEACQERFMIWERNLPFLGVVELDDKDIPVKIISRLNCVKDNDERLQAFFESGIKALKGDNSEENSR